MHKHAAITALLVALYAVAFGQDAPQRMQPRILLGDSSHCDAIMIREGHISADKVCTKKTHSVAEVAWDGHVATITASDERASQEWIRNHSIRSRLSIKKANLYWDGKRVDLGRTAVSRIDAAIPWHGGVLISGQTVPRKKFFQSWPFKGPFFDVRGMEPWCLVFFDVNTLKGEDYYFTSFAGPFSLLVFPLPD